MPLCNALFTILAGPPHRGQKWFESACSRAWRLEDASRSRSISFFCAARRSRQASTPCRRRSGHRAVRPKGWCLPLAQDARLHRRAVCPRRSHRPWHADTDLLGDSPAATSFLRTTAVPLTLILPMAAFLNLRLVASGTNSMSRRRDFSLPSHRGMARSSPVRETPRHRPFPAVPRLRRGGDRPPGLPVVVVVQSGSGSRWAKTAGQASRRRGPPPARFDMRRMAKYPTIRQPVSESSASKRPDKNVQSGTWSGINWPYFDHSFEQNYDLFQTCILLLTKMIRFQMVH